MKFTRMELSDLETIQIETVMFNLKIVWDHDRCLYINEELSNERTIMSTVITLGGVFF